MKTSTIKIPDTLDLNVDEVVTMVAARLYEQGRPSMGQAAKLAGLSRRTFAERLGRYDVSIFNYPASDISKDVKNA